MAELGNTRVLLVDTGFRKRSCATERLERDNDSKRSHPALGPHARIIDRGRSPRRQRARIHFYDTAIDPHAVSSEFFGEWRRCATVLEPILIAVPGTRHASVDDMAFSDRAVLMGAKIGERADLLAVAKDGDAFTTGSGNDACALVRDGLWRSDGNPALAAWRETLVYSAFTPASDDVQRRHAPKTRHQHGRNEQRVFAVHDAEGDMRDHQSIGDIQRHMERLPDPWGQEQEPKIMAGCRHQKQDKQRGNTKRLEGKIDELGVIPPGRQLRDQIRQIVLDQVPREQEAEMDRRDDECQHPEMTSIVQQWEEAA